MSPEYAMHGVFSEKSDVFSFGVLLLEIVSARLDSAFSTKSWAAFSDFFFFPSHTI